MSSGRSGFVLPVALPPGPLCAVQAADRGIARQAALQARAVAEFAAQAGCCTTDHRGEHQAPGWTCRLGAVGTHTVTTPTGLVAVTAPPPC
jgi:hypothetical protein